ncbi:MAG: hypothetical protein AAB385_06595, partial [Planctomycetota bacterium]
MHIGAERAVAQRDVLFRQKGVQGRDLGHVVGAKRRHRHVADRVRACVDHEQQVGRRKSAALRLSARLPEVLTQLVRVGHREARPVQDRHPMSVPATQTMTGGPQGRVYIPDQLPERFQRQPRPSLTVGRPGHVCAGDAGHVLARRVAVENLMNEHVHRLDGIEFTLTPRVPDLLAHPPNTLRREAARQTLANPTQRLIDRDHPWPPKGMSPTSSLSTLEPSPIDHLDRLSVLRVRLILMPFGTF